MDLLRGVSLVLAVITMGLSAGLFTTFSYAVMPGLRRTDDRAFVAAMSNINRAMLNGRFAAVFAGALVWTALAVLLHLGAPGVLLWAGAALVLYVAVLIITFAVNVPLNNRLDAAQPGDDAATRRDFERKWVRWNDVRSLVVIAASACVTWSLVLYGQGLA
ncbi:anthrone oxygenase family protein [Sphaerisporangium sp. TRM90804]|uniref:anthrone oxygenase family protein n=1 Tax=Sphaerisporangium sp. TRM90804 TaxID=3031113 RepID=UPI0032665BE0